MSCWRRPATLAAVASFLVETHVAKGGRDSFATAAESLRAAIAEMARLDGQLRHVRSYLVPSDELGFHVVEADSAEAVIRLARIAGIDVERIVSAVGIDSETGG
jgi:hypothetical protein